MIEITYQTFENPERKSVSLSFENFYDPLDLGETYENDGVEKHLDCRNYIQSENDSICWLRVKTPSYICETEYGKGGSLTEHTIYTDNTEKIIIQSYIEEKLIHNVMLLKSNTGHWGSSCIELIDDKNAQIIDLK